MPTRRQFIKTGLIGGAALMSVRIVYGPFSNTDKPIADDYRFAFLNEAQRTVVAAIAPVILAGALPTDREVQGKALRDVVRGLDWAISGFTPQVQSEVRQLFDLLTFPPTSRLELLQSAHQALRQLIFAAWYGNADSWSLIGYGGPPILDVR